MTCRLIIFFILFTLILFGTTSAQKGKEATYLISGIIWSLFGCLEIYIYHAFTLMGIIGLFAVGVVVMIQLVIMDALNPKITIFNRIFALLTFLFCLF